MLIAQISDLHCRPVGTLYQGVVDSNRRLLDAVAHLHALDVLPDLVLVTGDLVDEGQPAEYEVVRAALATLRMPYLVIPGNHDDRENFRSAFAHLGVLPATGPINYCVDDGPVRIVAVDSCVPGRHHGMVESETLAWLRATLEADQSKQTLLMLHHPPFMCGIPYMDSYRLMNGMEVAAIVREFDNIEMVVCGHVHRAMVRRWAGTVVCACPSTTTEIGLRLQPRAEPTSYLGPVGCLLHHWNPHDGLTTHLSHVGHHDGPHPFA